MDIEAIRSQADACASQAVELARRLGADQSEAGVSADEGMTVTVRLGEIESVERHNNRGLSVTVYKNASKGSASTTDLSDTGLEAAVRKALSIASYTAADPHAGLADPELLATEFPDLGLYTPWSLSVEDAERLAQEAEETARSSDARITNTEGATVATDESYRAYANSHGFLAGYPSTSHSLSCSVIAASGDQLEADYWYSYARDPDALDSPAQVGRTAATRAIRRLDAVQLATRSVPVVFPAELARGLFGHLLAAISGPSQYRRASFLLGAVDSQVFPDYLQIDERPHLPGAFGSSTFDADGVATRDRRLIDGGVLTGYLLGAYSARRLGLQSTGNAGGAHNLLVSPTAGGHEDLLHAEPRLFLVGELLGQGVNTVTGDYSRGAAGFWVENGEIVHAVNEVTIAGNLAAMFQDIVAVGNDIDSRGVVQTGSVLVGQMTIAGQ